MNKVRQILKTKGSQVWTISREANLLDALALLREKNIGALVVMDGQSLEGIFSERDYVQKVDLAREQPGSVRLEDVMTREIICVDPGQSINDCMQIMTEKHIRHLPVLENGQLVGIISIGDVVKDMIEELQFMVKQLENYITGLR
jgi:CBS domain-containing protein